MKLKHFRLYIVVIFSFSAPFALFAQVGINTDEIESLIDEWNFAHNSRNIHSFERVYGKKLLFYTQNLPESKAIALKQQLFQLNPYFRQRITTEISYVPYSSGVVKCDFTKEVFEKTHWKKYPSYLLVSYENNNYSIVGESDYHTDRVLKYKQDLGQKITFEKEETKPESAAKDTAIVLAASPMPNDTVDSLASAPLADTTDTAALIISNLEAMFSDPSALGLITIPKGYVFILIALLALGGVMIFIADSIHSRKSRRRMPMSTQRPDEAEQVVQDFKMQSTFEDFVITLFDPLFFRYRRVKTEYVYAGKGVGAEKGPDLIFDFRQKETHARFAIKCQYYKHLAKNEVQLQTSEQQQVFRQFEEDREMDVYYVLGFGGRPDDPRELFFVPAKEVPGEYLGKAFLRQYSKSGMFYFNKRTGRMQ